jgi:hypothetical protein
MNRLSDIQKIEVVEKFKSGIATKQIALEYNKETCEINKFLRRRNLLASSPKYTVKHDIFSIIDSEEKAYFLGVLYADGCVHKNVVKLSLQELDKDILLKFRDFLGSNHKINIRKDPRQPNSPDILTVSIGSKQIVNDLKKLGCMERKSLILEFPTKNQVPPELIKHFIRGYFDGDGSFTKYFNKTENVNKYCSTIVSTYNFCITLDKVVKKNCNINTYLQIRHKNRKTTTRQLKISGRKQVFRFLAWIYDEATIYMNRKYNKYQCIKQEFENRK